MPLCVDKEGTPYQLDCFREPCECPEIDVIVDSPILATDEGILNSMRCPTGMKWNGTRCLGSPGHTNDIWMQANIPPNQTLNGNGVTTNIFGDFSLIEWVKAHPIITLAVVGGILYIVFAGGLGAASSKVRTDVTRWGL